MDTRRVWTIGHSVRSADEFVALLQANQIDRLADIRTIPQSRRHPHFGADALAGRLAREGIQYRHLKNLGGLRKPRAGSANTGWKNESFRGYADHMQTKEFGEGIDELLSFAEGGRLAAMCAEALWWQCHRMLLADALTARQIDVQHIISSSSVQPHRLTRFAKISSDGQVSYPGNQTDLFSV